MVMSVSLQPIDRQQNWEGETTSRHPQASATTLSTLRSVQHTLKRAKSEYFDVSRGRGLLFVRFFAVCVAAKTVSSVIFLSGVRSGRWAWLAEF